MESKAITKTAVIHPEGNMEFHLDISLKTTNVDYMCQSKLPPLEPRHEHD